MAAHLTVGQRRRVRELRGRGLSGAMVAREVGCSLSTVLRVQAGSGKREARQAPLMWAPGGRRLTMSEREEISVALAGGESLSQVARRLGRSPSTICREVAANGGRAAYRPSPAQHRAFERARRPKTPKLADARLAAQVRDWLAAWWSPQQISRRLRAEFPDDPMMRVSHETIYQSIYVQGRGELRRELSRCLRSGRAKRRPQGQLETRGRIPGMVNISERPPQAADRAVPGQWEGDLIIGQDSRSAVGTLVERATGYVLLLHLPNGRSAEQVEAAIRRAVAKLPGLSQSIAWDQGKEMANHRQLTAATGVDVFFCDPHSPWQRGSNENTNGLLRQYLPKGTDLSVHSEADLDRIAASLNNRPRRRLDYLKPSERLTQILATTP